MASSLNEDPEGSRITYVKGDLFPSCISEDCRRMGAGRDKLLNQREFLEKKKSGEVAVLKRDGRYIYYLDWMWS
uniref:Uncharacterized protein n=1 Tax=Rhinopithecus bieti TaxID=61621 RepID=A0A2K6KEK2_RHIBE